MLLNSYRNKMRWKGGKRKRSKNVICLEEHFPLRWAPSLLQNVTPDIEPADLIDLSCCCCLADWQKHSKPFPSYLQYSGACRDAERLLLLALWWSTNAVRDALQRHHGSGGQARWKKRAFTFPLLVIAVLEMSPLIRSLVLDTTDQFHNAEAKC